MSSSLFEAVSYVWLWAAFFILAILCAWVGDRATPKLDPKVKESLDVRPMLALEFAGSVSEAERILKVTQEIDPKGREKFLTAIWWDYLFIFIYPAWIAVGCMLVAKFLSAHNLPGAPLGLMLIALQPLAAFLDGVENYALWRVLRGPVESPWPQIAKLCALPKFGITLGTAVIYVMLYGIGAFIWAKATGR